MPWASFCTFDFGIFDNRGDTGQTFLMPVKKVLHKMIQCQHQTVIEIKHSVISVLFCMTHNFSDDFVLLCT